MGRPTLKVQGYTAEEIEQLIKRDERYTIGIRLYAVHQVALGVASRKLEQLYHVSFKQITNWVHRFEKEGIDGLRDKPRPGRRPALSQQQLDQLKEILTTESPTTYGYNTESWTGPIIIDWVGQHFQVTYKKAQIYNIIKKLGFSYQKTKGIYPEADPEAQKAFQQALKKTPRST
jgi:transposase